MFSGLNKSFDASRIFEILSIHTYMWLPWLVALPVKNLPAMRETQVQSLGWEEPLEKGMATHSCILAWRIPQTKEPRWLQSMGSQKSLT